MSPAHGNLHWYNNVMKVTAETRFSTLVALLVLIQSIYPSGFMPGSISDGSFITLCPEGLPTAFIGGHQDNHAHHRAHDLSHDLSHEESAQQPAPIDNCELVSALDQPCHLLVHDIVVASGIPAARAFDATGNAFTQSTSTGFRARAPPALS